MEMAMDDKYLQKPTQKMIEPPQLMKKLIPLFLCSLSTFSVLMIWFFSSCTSPHSIFSTYFSNTSQVAVTNPIDRKFVFLVFNGLLIFIAKTSRFTYNPCASQSSANNTNSWEQSHDDRPLQPVSTKTTQVADSTHPNKNVVTILISSHGENLYGDWVRVEDPDEKDVKEEDDGGAHELSTEELNKKCDEFIKRVKEEIRIEAREQVA